MSEHFAKGTLSKRTHLHVRTSHPKRIEHPIAALARLFPHGIEDLPSRSTCIPAIQWWHVHSGTGGTSATTTLTVPVMPSLRFTLSTLPGGEGSNVVRET